MIPSVDDRFFNEEKPLNVLFSEVYSFAGIQKDGKELENALDKDSDFRTGLSRWLTKLLWHPGYRDAVREHSVVNNVSLANRVITYLEHSCNNQVFLCAFKDILDDAASSCQYPIPKSIANLEIAYERTTLNKKDLSGLACSLLKVEKKERGIQRPLEEEETHALLITNPTWIETLQKNDPEGYSLIEQKLELFLESLENGTIINGQQYTQLQAESDLMLIELSKKCLLSSFQRG